MTFLLKRIIRCGSAFHHNFICLNLKRLFRLRRCHKCSGHNDCRTHILFGNLLKVVHRIMVNDLKRLKIRSVIYHDESKCL